MSYKDKGFAHILVLITIVLVGIAGISYLAIKNNPLHPPTLPTSPTPGSNQTPTGDPTNQQTNLVECNKTNQVTKSCTAKNIKISFQIPLEWNVKEVKDSSSKYGNLYTLISRDSEKNVSNEIYVYTDPTYMEFKGSTIEEKSDELISFTISYIPGVSYNAPKIQSKEKVIIDGKVGYKYLIKYAKHEYVTWDYESRIFLFENDQLYLTIVLSGNNQDKLNQILSTFEFTK